MNWKDLEEIRLLFATGSPKSGTTFLQMILNNHPEVSCPPEHYLFDLITQKLPGFLENYNKSIIFIDKATANQGAPVFTEEDVKEIGKFVIKLAAYRGAKGKQVKWYGIKDDQLTERNGFILLENLFPDARFIGIIRDPRSVVISAWHFNIRIHPDFLERFQDSKEKWIEYCANCWLKDNNNLINFFKKSPSKILLCRYEDLVLSPFEHYKRIFEFLNVSTEKNLIEEIIEKTSFNKFKDGKFFRKGRVDSWEEELTPLEIKTVEKICGALMNLLGYKTSYC